MHTPTTSTVRAIQDRIQRAATYLGYICAAMMLAIAGMTWLVNSDWFIQVTNSGHAAFQGANQPVQYDPSIVNAGLPVLLLVCGFLVVLAALCGGFRKA